MAVLLESSSRFLFEPDSGVAACAGDGWSTEGVATGAGVLGAGPAEACPLVADETLRFGLGLGGALLLGDLGV